MVYEPRLPGSFQDDLSAWIQRRLTQLNVFSASRFDSFVLRDSFTAAETGLDGVQPVISGFTGTPFSIPLYAPHAYDVSFTFAQGNNVNPILNQVSSPLTTTKPLPLDYGNAADPGAIAVNVEIETAVNNNFYPGGKPIRRQPNEPGFANLQFPITAAPSTQYQATTEVQSMPILLVQYVEIFGEMPKTMKPA